jgi:serine phosphatase RsbU (regulator of sigma subunit)
MLFTDGLTEARRHGKQFGLDGVSAALGGLRKPAQTEAVASGAHASPRSPTAP